MNNRYVSRIVVLVGLVIAVVFILPYFMPVQLPNVAMSAFGSETARARVTQIIEEGNVDLGTTTQRYQIARVELLDGEYRGISMEMDYGKRQVLSGEIYLQPGDTILVTIGKRPDGILTVYFVDFVRIIPILWLAGIFAISIILISGWKGFRSIVGMVFSLAIIISYIIPHILAGEDPVRVSIIGSAILLATTLYLTYGWNLKSHAAVISMALVLIITGTLAWFFVVFTRLTGTGDENSLYLVQLLNSQINLRGLLLGGMIIGALGVLDDLVMTQASAVFELHHSNESLGFRVLYQSAMRIGQDHVAATVNTLVLAYAGASLPMLLLFTLGRGNYDYLINFAFVAEEIVRTLVGSLGLVAAVPLTTAIAIWMALRADSFGWWRQFLGPEGGGDGGHVH